MDAFPIMHAVHEAQEQLNSAMGELMALRNDGLLPRDDLIREWLTSMHKLSLTHLAICEHLIKEN